MAAWRSKTNSVSTTRSLTATEALARHDGRCRARKNSVNACATTAEIVTPYSRACARTRAASDAGSLTVNTRRLRHHHRPRRAASTYRRACRGEQPNRSANTRAASAAATPAVEQLGGRVDPLGVLPERQPDHHTGMP